MIRAMRLLAFVLVAACLAPLTDSACAQPAATPIPESTYSPLQASRDAHAYAEQRRREAFERQRGLVSQIDWYNTWVRPYVGSLPEAYIAPAPRVLRRYTRGRYGTVVSPWPIMPGEIYGYPYRDPAPQPSGHQKTYTSPNGYIYRPIFPKPATPEQVPTPAVRPAPVPAPEAPPRRESPRVPAESIGQGPVLNPPAPPRPEVIPTPPAKRGPREF